MNMIVKILALSFLCCISVLSRAQLNMKEGFDYLEKGSFAKAESYFAEVLNNYPNNKTAQLCYGRAVGLNGDPEKAISLFQDLLLIYPKDLEITLNYYESYLWAKKFEEALPLYKKLVSDYPSNFTANLGYANTLSNLKEYEAALLWINKALELKPQNANAKVSRKYIKLGYANAYSTQKQYAKAEEMLLSIFDDFPDDKDILLNLANLYLVSSNKDKAIDVYGKMAISKIDSIKSLAGISLVYHIAEKDKIALSYATKAKTKSLSINDSISNILANERFTQALIWNRKFKLAETQLDSLSYEHKNEKWYLALVATLGMYKSEYDKSIDAYNKILDIDSASFDGNLGKANAHFASSQINKAYKSAFTTLKYYDQQKDALAFIAKLNKQYSPYVHEQLAFTFDNGDNSALWSNTSLYIPINEKLTTFAWYKYRKTQNRSTLYNAESNTIGAGASYVINSKIKLNGQIGINKANADSLDYMQPTIELTMAIKPFPLHDLSIGYKREMQNFNAELIAQEIVMQHLSMTYNLGTNINLGWYTQMMYTIQTDQNSRNLLFTSVYYNLLRKPLLKTGINYQYMSFKDQLPAVYFSPEQYHALEWFVDSRGKLFKNTSYISNFALGQQKVEDDDLSTLFRAEVGLTQEISSRLSVNIYGLYSNVASATAAGFEYVEFGLKIKWQLTKLPLFYNKLDKQ